jgi:Skp family chaperone for outer membrane proteins
LFDLVVEMSEQRGFNILLEKNDLLFAVQALEISDAVIAALDERLPNVVVPMPEN